MGPYDDIGSGHVPDQEPDQATRVYTASLKSDRYDTIGIDSDEPMQGIRISTVPPTIGPLDTIGTLHLQIKWARASH